MNETSTQFKSFNCPSYSHSIESTFGMCLIDVKITLYKWRPPSLSALTPKTTKARVVCYVMIQLPQWFSGLTYSSLEASIYHECFFSTTLKLVQLFNRLIYIMSVFPLPFTVSVVKLSLNIFRILKYVHIRRLPNNLCIILSYCSVSLLLL